MKILLLFICIIISVQIIAQNAPDTLWTRTIGGNNSDDALDICETTDGGFIIAGYEFYSNIGDDCLLIKTDVNGFVQWEKVFGGSDSEKARSVQQTTDGGYIIAGYTSSFGLGFKDMWLIKTDENGDLLWDYTYGSNFFESASSVQQTADNGYIIAGVEYVPGPGASGNRALLVKTDQYGIEEWRQTYGNSGYDFASSVQQTTDGGYVVAGTTFSEDNWDNFWLLKLNNNGIIQWEQTFGGSNSDRASSVLQTSNGGYILAGESNSYGSGDMDCLIIKTDNNGTFEWEQILGGDNDDSVSTIQPTSEGGYILAGYTKPFESVFQGDFWIININENGNLLWDHIFVSDNWEMARSALQTSDGGYIIAGFTQTEEPESRDILLIRLGTESEANNSIIHNQDFMLVNYPNPFNPETTIEFSIQDNSQIELSIYNSKGQKVKTISDNYFEKGNHSAIWNGEDTKGNPVSSGVYLYKLNVNGKTEAVKKCILLK